MRKHRGPELVERKPPACAIGPRLETEILYRFTRYEKGWQPREIAKELSRGSFRVNTDDVSRVIRMKLRQVHQPDPPSPATVIPIRKVA